MDAPSDPRNTSTTSTSSKGENGLLRKLILKRLADMNKITSKVVDDDTDLKKVKVLGTRTVPKLEKAVRELENTGEAQEAGRQRLPGASDSKRDTKD